MKKETSAKFAKLTQSESWTAAAAKNSTLRSIETRFNKGTLSYAKMLEKLATFGWIRIEEK